MPRSNALPGPFINIQGLRTDPDYLALAPEERSALMKHAITVNLGVYKQQRTAQPLEGFDEFGRFDPFGGQLASGQGDANAPQVYPGVLPTAGGIVGNLLGSRIPGGRVPLGALGTTMGQALEDINLGKATVPKSLREALMAYGENLVTDLAFQGVESATRGMGRMLLRGTPAGARIRFDELAGQARALAGKIFSPLPKDTIGAMFDQVRDSGVRITGDTTQSFVQALDRGRFNDLLHDIRQVDRANKTGGFYEGLLKNLRGQAAQPQTSVLDIDIGQAQTLSSGIRRRVGQAGQAYEGSQLLRDFRESLDTDIFEGAAAGAVPSAGDVQELLKQARGEYARFRGAEELSGLIEDKISYTPDRALASFSIIQFENALRRNRASVPQAVNRALDSTPGARETFERELADIAKQFRTVEISLSDTQGFRRLPILAGLSGLLGDIVLNPRTLPLFREALINGRGTLSANAIAALASVAKEQTVGDVLPPSMIPEALGVQE